MKNTHIKSIALGAIIFGMGTASLFAKDMSRPARQNSAPSSRIERPSQNKASQPQKLPAPRNLPNRNGGSMAKADLLGTISAVSEEKSLLTVRDADGNEIQVHVNPFTRINAIPSAEERKAAAENKSQPQRKNPAENRLTISDVKAGDWVAVKKLAGETKTLEAGTVIVVKK